MWLVSGAMVSAAILCQSQHGNIGRRCKLSKLPWSSESWKCWLSALRLFFVEYCSMGKVKTYRRAELALSTIKLGLQQRENVVEPFCPHQIKITVALDDFKGRKRQILLDVCHSRQFPQLLLLVSFPIANCCAVHLSSAQVWAALNSEGFTFIDQLLGFLSLKILLNWK